MASLFKDMQRVLNEREPPRRFTDVSDEKKGKLCDPQTPFHEWDDVSSSGKLHKPDKPSQDLSTPHKAMQEAGCLHRGYKRKHLLARGHQSSYGV